MRPFDFELWKAGEPVILRNGQKVEQLTKFDLSNKSMLAGVVDESFFLWEINGSYFSTDGQSNFDLVHPEKERWANIYKHEDYECLGMVCYSLEEAKLSANGRDNYIGTYKLVKP